MSRAERVALLPGPSQRGYALAAVVAWLASMTAALLVVVVAFSPIGNSGGSVVRIIAVLVFVGGLGTVAVLFTLSKRKAAAEADAGYTTATRLRQDLTQVDNASGVVIRKAGDPFLESAQMRAAYKRARQEGAS